MKKITVLFLVWAGIIYTFTFLSSTPAFFDYSYENTSIIKEDLPHIRHLLNFDGGHYQNISRFGYIKQFQTAFFPLYPILINLLSSITHSYVISALLISLICAYLSIILFVRFHQKSHPKSALNLIFFPLSFFFLTGYTESLFLLLSLLAWHSFRKGRYLMSGGLGLLASLSRFYGVFLLPSLVLEFLLKLPKNKRWKISSYKPIAPLLLIPLGLAIYMAYLRSAYHDPLAFIHAQALWNRGEIVSLFRTVYRYLKIFITVSPQLLQFWVAFLEFLSLAFGLFASYVLYKQKHLSYSLYVFLGSTVPSLTGTLQSLPRYILVLFPIYFITLPNKLRIPIFAASFALQLLLLTAFLTGKFIA